MKEVSAIVLSIILFLSIFGQGITVVRFHIHKKYIASELCENRNRPMLHCDGKCVLSQKLKAQEKQQEDAGIVLSEKFEIIFTEILPINISQPSGKSIKTTYNLYCLPSLTNIYRAIFTPPDNNSFA
jgi:hypothetical protein